MVTPSYMLALLDEFERQGLDARESSLQVGIFGAEPWTEDMRREVEERAGLHAVDIYGLSEVMGRGVASECVETKDGLHVWEDHFYPEVVDPQTGAVLPDGERGELVFTSLTKQAMPVVRYRTRDLTRLLPGHGPHGAAHRADHRALGRHAHPARGQRLPDAGRGAAAARAGALAALPARPEPAAPPRRDDRPVEARPDRAAHERVELAERLCALVKDSVGVTSPATSSSRRRCSAPRARRSGSSTCGG
jgi:phenylacetate-CoA ligase